MLLSDSYLPGALVLAHSLRDAGTKKKLAVLVTLDSVSANAITQLQTIYNYIIPVPRIRNEHPANLSLMNRSDLHSAFTKINLWKQTQFSKIVYLDADVVAYRAPDELFNVPVAFSAAPDIGWPDIFNTGVMVLTPNMGDYYAMLAMAERGISFDGADQGLINMHFKHCTNRLPFTYNVTPSSHYQYIPAYLYFQSSISMVHFIGPNKPWFSGRVASHNNDPVAEMSGLWWAVHDRHYGTQNPSSNNFEHHKQGTIYETTAETPDSATLAHISPAQMKKLDINVDLFEHRQKDRESNQSSGSATSGRPSQTAVETQGTESIEALEQEKSPFPTPAKSWDAQRQSPPLYSKPEAINFTSVHYEMSRDITPFVPPVRYPSPPKNMWYDVPKQPRASAEKLRQIFPWEARQPAPLRSFVDPPLHEPLRDSQKPEASIEAKDMAPSRPQESASSDPGVPIISVTAGMPREEKSEILSDTTADLWDSFPRANAWDEVPEIGQYVKSLQDHRRSKSRNKAKNPVSASSTLATVETLQMPRVLKVTDFPTAVERPSLPVTPAPITRPSFWGQDSDCFSPEEETHPFPVAEGVPSQPDWVCVHGWHWGPTDCPCNLTDMLLSYKDPATQLQKLAQQQSEALLRRLSGDDGETGRRLSHDMPSRPLPFGSETLQSPTSPTCESPASTSSVLSPKPLSGRIPATSLVEGLAGATEPEAPITSL